MILPDWTFRARSSRVYIYIRVTPSRYRLDSCIDKAARLSSRGRVRVDRGTTFMYERDLGLRRGSVLVKAIDGAPAAEVATLPSVVSLSSFQFPGASVDSVSL